MSSKKVTPTITEKKLKAIGQYRMKKSWPCHKLNGKEKDFSYLVKAHKDMMHIMKLYF